MDDRDGGSPHKKFFDEAKVFREFAGSLTPKYVFLSMFFYSKSVVHAYCHQIDR
jgi:hypothetical protein